MNSVLRVLGGVLRLRRLPWVSCGAALAFAAAGAARGDIQPLWMLPLALLTIWGGAT